MSSTKRIDNKFGYWCLGWLLMLTHPIKRAIDLGKSTELLVEMNEPTKLTKEQKKG